MTIRPLTIAYLYTTFPKSTETFMQREVIAMRARGVNLRIYSLIGGGGTFAGIEVTRFSMWRLLELIWVIPKVALTRWDVFGVILRGLCTRRPPSWLNFWENMLGAGFAGLWYPEFRRSPPDLIHAAWGGAPATAAWMLHKLNGHPYSAAAHAYDLYEHGGDWWLYEKLVEARFIHTSTQMGADTLTGRGLPAGRVHVIRRGLDVFPPIKALRQHRARLRIVSVARLVAKKGLRHQLHIYAAARAAGLDFEARIVGEGPLRSELESLARSLGLGEAVTFLGHCDQAKVWAEFAWADVLIHTGIVAPSGDRDGLPNVIPEAMTAGTLVITSPVAATCEAIHDGETGLVASVEDPAAWVAAFRRLASDDILAGRLQQSARRWVETEYNAHRNAERLHDLLLEAARP
ncbi:MAG TPA: glycosyltransferase family 4 protein [Opitutaceae bacterium]